jgi:excinuclease UvrABC nuclease subunit
VRTPAAHLRSLKRRRPGVYAYRTRRHLGAGTEWGYVGKARNLATRDKCHHGTCHHHCVIKPWMDLEVRRYAIRLPWWLGFDFITLSLETLVILALQPRYNWQKNPRRSKVGPRGQATQRLERDLRPASYRARVQAQRLTNIAVRTLAVVIIFGGIGGYLWTR